MTDIGIDTRDTQNARPGWTADRVGELIFAGLIVALGAWALIGAFGIRTPVGSQVGPRVFPILVAVILLLAGVALVIGVFRGQLGAREESEDTDPDARTDWLTLGKIVLAVIGVAVVLEFTGWAIAAGLLFGVVAWSLGAKRWWLAFVVGIALGVATQIVFGELLGLSLPRGVLFGWLG